MTYRYTNKINKYKEMRHKILFILLLILIQIPDTKAQDYVYSVTLGTSWAREVFPAIERAQRNELMRNPSVIEGAPKFTKLFLDYEYDYKRFNSYNDSIFFKMPQEEWINLFKRRAVKYSQLYSKNNKNIAQLKDYFSDSYVPEAAYDSLYYWTRHLLFRNVNDIFFYEMLVDDILLPHYEETQDVEHLVLCYLCSGMAQFQISRMGDKDAEMRSELFFHKLMNMSGQFASFKDPLNRYYLISAFVNLAILHAQSGNISLNECINLVNDMKKMYERPETQKVLQQDSLLNEYAKWSIDVFRFRGIFTYMSQGKNLPELRNQLYQLYSDVRNELGVDKPLKNRYYAKLDFDDLLVEAFMGNITWNDAFHRFRELMAKEPDFTSNKGVPQNKINYLYNLSESYFTILDHTTYSFEKKREFMNEYLSTFLDILSRYEHSKYPYEKGKILSNIACNPTVLKFQTPEEKEALMFRLIVLEQPVTYVHVSMVADLSRALAEEIIDKMPAYFIGLPGYASVEDVQGKRDDLLNLVSKSALYHDLGKISMPTVITNSFRRLTDHEYKLIKMHPENSRQFFAINPSFQTYQDVALGHHKWYDGDGYPASFKHRKSPYFPLICLVTVTDCMDAATENVGRNYHTPKDFETVMAEFNAYIGEQFHPDLLNFINNDQVVYDKLKTIVSDRRYDFYYDMYKRYMSEKAPAKKTNSKSNNKKR